MSSRGRSPCLPAGRRRIPWLSAIIGNHCCVWDSSLPAELDGASLRMTAVFLSSWELQPRRIPWLLAIISHLCCAWDSSLPAFGGAPLRMTAEKIAPPCHPKSFSSKDPTTFSNKIIWHLIAKITDFKLFLTFSHSWECENVNKLNKNHFLSFFYQWNKNKAWVFFNNFYIIFIFFFY